MVFVNHNPRKNSASGNNEELSLPVAAGVQAFLQQALEERAGKWLEEISSFAHNVPALSGNILELHFDKVENNVDFATRLNNTYDKGMIAGVKRGDYDLPFLPYGFASLLDCNNAIKHGIENIWIEYDAPFSNAPALFFDIHKSKPFDPQEAYASLQEIAGVLDYPLRKPLFGFLKKIKEEGLRVVYYGLMFSRKQSSVRLTIHGVTVENLIRVLQRLGWKRSYGALNGICSRFLHKFQKLVIGVDFGNGLEPRIGVEVFDENKQALMQKLHDEGCINKEQYESLKIWEQIFVLPDHLANALTELHQRPIKELHTRVNHFKFVLDDTERIKTKGYLYYCF